MYQKFEQPEPEYEPELGSEPKSQLELYLELEQEWVASSEGSNNARIDAAQTDVRTAVKSTTAAGPAAAAERV